MGGRRVEAGAGSQAFADERRYKTDPHAHAKQHFRQECGGSFKQRAGARRSPTKPSNRAIRVLSPACFPSRLTAKTLRMRERREGSTTTTLDLLGCDLRTALGQIGSIRRRPHERLWSKLSRTGVTRKGHGHIDFCQHDPPSPRIFLAVRTAASPLGGPLFSAGSHC
jgi:hypothetical protein